MAMAVGPGRGYKSDINVTPLVDVCLVLLIIFMVVTPMLQRGKEVELPKAHKIEKDRRESEPIIVSVTKDEKIYLEKDLVDEKKLEDDLRDELWKKPREILLKGDDKLEFGVVRKVMNVARAAGARGVSCAVQEMKE